MPTIHAGCPTVAQQQLNGQGCLLVHGGRSDKRLVGQSNRVGVRVGWVRLWHDPQAHTAHNRHKNGRCHRLVSKRHVELAITRDRCVWTQARATTGAARSHGEKTAGRGLKDGTAVLGKITRVRWIHNQHTNSLFLWSDACEVRRICFVCNHNHRDLDIAFIDKMNRQCGWKHHADGLVV